MSYRFKLPLADQRKVIAELMGEDRKTSERGCGVTSWRPNVLELLLQLPHIRGTDSKGPMLTRLTRAKRLTAARLLALAYLFCVLAPGSALALGDAASCFVRLIPMTAVQLHENSLHQHHEAHGNQHSSPHADADNTQHDHAKHDHKGKTLPGPCCAILCLSALLADLPDIAQPSRLTSVCISERLQRLTGEPPPLHYRPPIV